MKKLDITALKKFLEHTGCALYFAKDPFVVAGNTARINDIEDSTLIRWVEEYNSYHAPEAPDSKIDNGPPWVDLNREGSNETD